MKRFLFILLAAWLTASCAVQERALYLQDLTPSDVDKISTTYQIRLKPLDRITVVVNSQYPELAAPFNTYSSYNSLTGTSISGVNSQNNSGNSMQVRTIDEFGMLDMPIIGQIYCAGKTRSEVATEIANRIIEGGYLSDPKVNIEFVDMTFSVLGEVGTPGRYEIRNNRLSLMDAVAMAGDLTIYGQREDVLVIREENGKRTYAELDLTSKEIFDSPYYYLQQNDIVYVKPNKYKAKSGGYSQDRSFYVGLVSTILSVATMGISIWSLLK